MLTELQKKAAQAIVNIFETGRAEGEYGKVTLLPGDPGHLTYRKSQTTLTSGNLFLLIKAYTESESAEFAPDLSEFLPIWGGVGRGRPDPTRTDEEKRYSGYGRGYVYVSGQASLWPPSASGKPQIVLTDKNQLSDLPPG